MSISVEEIVRSLEENPADLFGTEEVRAPGVFDAWIRRCSALVSADPETGLRHVDTALKIADTKCQTIQSLGLEISALCSLRRFDDALRQLGLAFRLAAGCAACEADRFHRIQLGYFSRAQIAPQALILRAP